MSALTTYPPLEAITAPTLPTNLAAHYLNRQPQTLRIWAMGRGNPPIRPVRVYGRLMWPTNQIRLLLKVAA